MPRTTFSANVVSSDREDLGKTLRTLRETRGLTTAQVGDHLGVSRAIISLWENGRTAVRPKYMGPLADLYGMDHMEFGKLMLRYRDPFLYALMFGVKGDKALQAVIERLSNDD